MTELTYEQAAEVSEAWERVERIEALQARATKLAMDAEQLGLEDYSDALDAINSLPATRRGFTAAIKAANDYAQELDDSLNGEAEAHTTFSLAEMGLK